jgi:hypothetical protein
MKNGFRLGFWLSVAVSCAALTAPVLLSGDAMAAPSANVTIAKKEIPDDNGWRLQMTIKLGAKPSSTYQTWKFIFRPKVIYETYVDDSGPDEKTRSMKQDDTATPLVEKFDISFGNAAGAIFDQTKFEVVLKRSRDFLAGEYKVEIRDADDNSVGKPFDLKLTGKNPTVNRKSMQFSSTDRKAPPASSSGSAGSGSGSSSGSSGDAPKDKIEKTEYDEPEAPKKPVKADFPGEVKEKPGGCGCEVPGRSSNDLPIGVALVSVFGVVAMRRRRSAKLASSNALRSRHRGMARFFDEVGPRA